MISPFKGEHSFLSNFYPVRIEHEYFIYPTVEHAYVASKTNDIKFKRRISILPADKAGKAKRMGSKDGMKKFGCFLKPDWHYIKESIMFDLLRLKFKHSDLAQMLINTGDEYLQEGNYWHDNFWGVCKCNDCRENTVGLNILGNLLIKVRKELKYGRD